MAGGITTKDTKITKGDQQLFYNTVLLTTNGQSAVSRIVLLRVFRVFRGFISSDAAA